VSLFSRLSRRSRSAKKALLEAHVPLGPTTRVLDIGAQTDPGGLLQLVDWYPWKTQLTAMNLRTAHLDAIARRYPEVTRAVGDACRLPWPDQSFDLVHANAVIEHVGDVERQARMAQEVMRVGRQWFVTTPNRWFPFEFHMRLPLVTWLPAAWMRVLGRACSYNHVQCRYRRGQDWSGLRLLGARELARLFPGSRVRKLRITLWAETLVALGGARRPGSVDISPARLL